MSEFAYSVNLRNLSVGQFGQGMTSWLYATDHSRRELEGHNYWNAIFCNEDTKHEFIKPGDFIFVKHKAKVALGNSIYAMGADGRVKLLCSTFNNGN